MSALEALLLGLVQGLTEFLPVSSSGHLVMLQSLLRVPGEGVLFEVAVHAATMAAVLWVYRGRVTRLAGGVLRGRPDDVAYTAKLMLATLPAAVAGVAARGFFEAQFERPAVTGLGLFVTGAVLWTTRHSAPRASAAEPGYAAALAIGCAQAFAILPGLSRSGLTVAAALALGVRPLEAAEFAFLMGAVAIAGATALELTDLPADAGAMAGAFAVGSAAALLSGLAAIALFVRLLRTRHFYRFAYYVWAAGALFLLWLWI